jgi:nucleotide-binding universal stress UspA family protein
MSLKDILVHIGDTKATEVRLKTALAIAKEHKAKITGLYVVPFPTALGTMGGMDESLDPSVFETMLEHGRARATVAKKAFKALTTGSGISCSWAQAEGYLVDVLSRHGRYADLIVLGQHDGEAPFDLDRRGMPDQIILEVARPVLVVPRQGNFTKIGKNPAVAWNGSAVATRAIHDAMPILEKAKKATVLTVEDKDAPRGNGSESDLAKHLSHHGVRATVEKVKSEDPTDGASLLRAVARRKADMIVMGAYGHWRLRELVLGGVTNHVLGNANVPVLMSH